MNWFTLVVYLVSVDQLGSFRSTKTFNVKFIRLEECCFPLKWKL